MKSNLPQTVVVIGGGPAGAAIATLLARTGCKTIVFHTDKRPPLIVGESLIPAVVPFLRELGVEDEVKSFSIFKPGATVCLDKDESVSAVFTLAKGSLPEYAYNCPRDLFDEAILKAAERAGAVIIRKPCKLVKDGSAVKLDDETLAAAGLTVQPDLVIDASGRSRVIPRLLNIPAIEGGRKDVAIFAHLDRAELEDAGHIHLTPLSAGWCWRIPLPGRVSVGVVIDPAHLKKYGETVEEQYDGYLKEEPLLKRYTHGAARVSPVVKYNNYQLVSTQMSGPGWLMVGDTSGFADPIFSSGTYLALKSAFDAFTALKNGRALKEYEAGRRRDLKSWQRIIDSWYNGRLFNMYRVGQRYRSLPFGKLMERRVRKRLVRIFTGEAVTQPFATYLFEYLLLGAANMRDPSDLAVR